MTDITFNDTTSSIDLLEREYEVTEEDIEFYYLEDSLDQCVQEYIAGFIVKKLSLKFDCTECINLLKVDKDSCPGYNLLVKRKDYSKLIYPSKELVNVVHTCDVILKGKSCRF